MPGEPGREGGGCLKQFLREVALGDQLRHISSMCRHGEGHLGRGTSVFRSKEVQRQGGRKYPLHVRDMAVGYCSQEGLEGRYGGMSHCMRGAM